MIRRKFTDQLTKDRELCGIVDNCKHCGHSLGIVDNAEMNPGVQYLLKSLLKNFRVLHVTCRSLICFELIFPDGVR